MPIGATRLGPPEGLGLFPLELVCWLGGEQKKKGTTKSKCPNMESRNSLARLLRRMEPHTSPKRLGSLGVVPILLFLVEDSEAVNPVVRVSVAVVCLVVVMLAVVERLESTERSPESTLSDTSEVDGR